MGHLVISKILDRQCPKHRENNCQIQAGGDLIQPRQSSYCEVPYLALSPKCSKTDISQHLPLSLIERTKELIHFYNSYYLSHAKTLQVSINFEPNYDIDELLKLTGSQLNYQFKRSTSLRRNIPHHFQFELHQNSCICQVLYS